MFFNTIETLIEHHSFKSANVQIAKDKNGLYAIVNLAPDLEKVTDEAMQTACSTPFVLRDTGDGFDISAEKIIQTVYESIVCVDQLDPQQLTNAVTKSNEKTASTSVSKKDNTKQSQSKPEPITQAVSSFFDDNEEL